MWSVRCVNYLLPLTSVLLIRAIWLGWKIVSRFFFNRKSMMYFTTNKLLTKKVNLSAKFLGVEPKYKIVYKIEKYYYFKRSKNIKC